MVYLKQHFSFSHILEMKQSQIQTVLALASAEWWYTALDLCLCSASPLKWSALAVTSNEYLWSCCSSIAWCLPMSSSKLVLRIVQLPNWVLVVKHDSLVSPLHDTVQI